MTAQNTATIATLISTAIKLVADSPEKVRVCDAWRLYDFAYDVKIVPEIKSILRKTNPSAFRAFFEYEGELIEERIRQNP